MAEPSLAPTAPTHSQETAQNLEDAGFVYLPQGVLSILVLFLFLRLTILFLYTPQGLLNSYSDYDFYYRTAQLSDKGYYPYINMWYEYPPLLAYLSQFAYEITQRILPAKLMNEFGYAFFLRILGSILLLFDAGVLVLLYRIGAKVWGNAAAAWLSWVYLSLSLPMFFWNYSHQVVPTFFLLLAMDLFLSQRRTLSALALGLGIAAKLTPLFFLAVALKFLWPDWKRILHDTSWSACWFLGSSSCRLSAWENWIGPWPLSKPGLMWVPGARCGR